MTARFRVALHGFSAFEREALSFCLKHAGARVPAYSQVERIADCDFIVADASHEAPGDSVTRGERMRDTLFVGDKPPPGAAAHLRRPLDPERILRALDKMVLQRIAPRRPPTDPPDVTLPLSNEELRFPVLDPRDIVEETTPAAFHPEALDLRLTDLDAVAAQADRSTDRLPLDDAPPPLPADPLAPPPRPARPPAPPPAPRPPEMTEEERYAAKAAARRKSRAARLAQARRNEAVTVDVLLLDPAPEPVALQFLLEAFGFRVQRATDIAGATGILEATPLAAAFIDVEVEDDEGVDGMGLCHLIKHGLLPLAGPVPPVMLLSRRNVASDGVRARLAGCDAFLTHPIRRGDAARALEAANVALPADERRSAR